MTRWNKALHVKYFSKSLDEVNDEVLAEKLIQITLDTQKHCYFD